MQEVPGAVQGLHGIYDRLNVPDLEPPFFKKGEAEFHQLIVIRFIPGGPPKLRNSRGFCKGYPDFGDQHTLQVETDEFHGSSYCFFLMTSKPQ